MRLGRLSTMAVLCIVGASSCRDKMFLRLGEDSTSKQLTIVIARDSSGATPVARIVQVIFRKQSCSYPREIGADVWRVTATDGVGPSPAPARIVYGVTPSGYSSGGTAMDLVEGCYSVDVSAPPTGRTLLFKVGADGVAK